MTPSFSLLGRRQESPLWLLQGAPPWRTGERAQPHLGVRVGRAGAGGAGGVAGAVGGNPCGLLQVDRVSQDRQLRVLLPQDPAGQDTSSQCATPTHRALDSGLSPASPRRASPRLLQVDRVSQDRQLRVLLPQDPAGQHVFSVRDTHPQSPGLRAEPCRS